MSNPTPAPIAEKMVSPKEAAEFLQCTHRTLKTYAMRGEIPAMRLGNRWKFLLSELDKWRRQKMQEHVAKDPQEAKAQ